jgi:transcriptional regulator with XRE-family HTH domain
MIETPGTLTAQKLLDAMEEKGMSIKELAEKSDTTYEHIRKILRGGSFPSKYMIRVLSELLNIKKSELEQLVAADQIRQKYGKIPAILSGKNPELEPVERIWNNLTPAQQADFVAQMQAVAKRNKKESLAS